MSAPNDRKAELMDKYVAEHPELKDEKELEQLKLADIEMDETENYKKLPEGIY